MRRFLRPLYLSSCGLIGLLSVIWIISSLYFSVYGGGFDQRADQDVPVLLTFAAVRDLPALNAQVTQVTAPAVPPVYVATHQILLMDTRTADWVQLDRLTPERCSVTKAFVFFTLQPKMWGVKAHTHTVIAPLRCDP